MYKTTYQSPIGTLALVSDKTNLVGLFIEGQKYFMASFDNVIKKDDLDVFSKTKELLDKYFNGEVIDNKNIPIKFIGTPFRCRVLNIVKDIPYGEIVTYKDIGDKVKSITGKNISYRSIVAQLRIIPYR